MNKKIAILIVIVIASYIGWYLLSPLFINKEVQESLPEEFIISDNSTDQTDQGETQVIPEKKEEEQEDVAKEEEMSKEKEKNEQKEETVKEEEDNIQEQEATTLGENQKEQDLYDDSAEIETVEEGKQVASEPTVTYNNDFEKVDHDVTGSYKIIENNGKSLLRIEGLDIANGPDLHFVLSNSNEAWGNNSFADIGPLPGNKGSYNVSIPDGINISDYKYLLIHCVQFAHTFASADL